MEKLELTIESKIVLVFKHENGHEVKLFTDVDDLLNKTLDELHDDLEGGCESGCYNESQNHCECDPKYTDYVFNRIIISK